MCSYTGNLNYSIHDNLFDKLKLRNQRNLSKFKVGNLEENAENNVFLVSLQCEVSGDTLVSKVRGILDSCIGNSLRVPRRISVI